MIAREMTIKLKQKLLLLLNWSKRNKIKNQALYFRADKQDKDETSKAGTTILEIVVLFLENIFFYSEVVLSGKRVLEKKNYSGKGHSVKRSFGKMTENYYRKCLFK